jgi:penicillin amidase
MQWTGAEPDDDAAAFFLLNHAVDYDDFATAMQTLNTPAQNFNYADTNGMIAMWVAGLFPIRGTGHGCIPGDGASGEYDWQGFIPKIDTPRSVNPAQDYLASANQRPAPEEYPYYLGYEWDPGYRARRINELLSGAGAITVDRMKAFQADTRDTAAESMLPHLIAACKDGIEPGSLYANALDTLSAWDFFTTVDSPAPTIWWKWMERLSDDVWADEWRAAGIELRKDSWGHTDLNRWSPPMEVLEYMVVKQPTSKWFDDVSTTDTIETLREIALKSLREAVDDIFTRLGPEIAEWQWGSMNRLRIDHLSGDPLLRRGGHPLSGSDLALNARGSGGDVTGGPSWRMVVDFADLGRSYGIFPGGQSGNPENPHYDDLINAWVRNEYIPLLFYPSPDQFPQEEIESRLSLTAAP